MASPAIEAAEASEESHFAGRKDIKEYFDACGYDHKALDKDGYPFEVRVPDELSSSMAERTYRNEDQMTKVNDLLDPRLHLQVIDHDNATFLLLVKNNPSVNYCDIGSYQPYWRALKMWARSALRGRVAILSDYIRGQQDKTRLKTAAQDMEHFALKSRSQAEEKQDEMLASVRRGTKEAQLTMLRSTAWQNLSSSMFMRTARWTMMTDSYLNGEQITRHPDQPSSSLSIDEIRTCIQDT